MHVHGGIYEEKQIPFQKVSHFDEKRLLFYYNTTPGNGNQPQQAAPAFYISG